MSFFRLAAFDSQWFGHRLSIPLASPRQFPALIPTESPPLTDPLYMKQVHGGTVHLVRGADHHRLEPGAFGDGIFTDIPRFPVMIFTADCIPLIIASENPRFIGVVHASWRSVATGIIENTAQLIAEGLCGRSSQFFCFMGPCILGEDYEVGEEVAKRFPESIRDIGKGKYLLDLPGEVHKRLLRLGVPEKSISMPPLSTFREKWLPSYRREGDDAGRIETIVWLE